MVLTKVNLKDARLFLIKVNIQNNQTEYSQI